MSDDDAPKDEPADPLTHRYASIGNLEWLRAEGLIAGDAFERGVELVWPADRAYRRFDRVLLALGLILVLAGVGYLFAYNWAGIPKFVRLGIVQAAVAVCFGVAAWRGLDGRVGNAALCAGAFLVGVFLVVFGQIYQTGTDTWEFFAGWAALITGFLIVGRSQALWMMWTALVTAAATLYVFQQMPWLETPGGVAFSFGVAGFHVGLVVLREWARTDLQMEWLAGRWSRWVLVATGLAASTYPAALLLVDGASQTEAALLGVSIVGWLVATGGCYWMFRHWYADMVVMTMVGLAAMAIPAVGLYRVVRLASLDTAMGLLAFSLGVLVMTAGLVAWLRILGERLGSDARSERREVPRE